MNVFAAVHILAASLGLVVGAIVLAKPKGTHTHRIIGTVYVAAMLFVNVAALSLHREDAFGVFHVLAVASLVSLVAGLLPVIVGEPSAPVIATHAYCMTWSYAGLVAAGCGQLAAAVGPDAGWVVPTTIGVVLCIFGAFIFSKVPSIVDRILVNPAS